MTLPEDDDRCEFVTDDGPCPNRWAAEVTVEVYSMGDELLDTWVGPKAKACQAHVEKVMAGHYDMVGDTSRFVEETIVHGKDGQ